MFKTIDLFAGAGGLSLGFKQTGQFKLLAAAEINESARETYRRNIPDGPDKFVFIENVIGYDFKKLNSKLNGIDVVIGGPPCQGFSNANRQKNHLISMNNALVKEYFRAIKEIQPKAFVMENVSMLESNTHRFYDSSIDHDAIAELNLHVDASGIAPIPFRQDKIVLSSRTFEGIDLAQVVAEENSRTALLLPPALYHLLHVLQKNKTNERRLPKYLEKHAEDIIKAITSYCRTETITFAEEAAVQKGWMLVVKEALENGTEIKTVTELSDIIDLQKVLLTAGEIHDNHLIGKYVNNGNELSFAVKSYAVIDYVKAILGKEYTQQGATLNAEWFGVPQERKRHIVIGIRNDILKQDFEMPGEPEERKTVTVWDAISDLKTYEADTSPKEEGIAYTDNETLSDYQAEMRQGSVSIHNHFTTNTTKDALKRFENIEQGENFLSLPAELKTTYSKPERTQKTIYFRLPQGKPSSTVVNVRKSMWIHPTLNRAISVREAARLQSFPDSFIFLGAKDSQYQQVGNAVPPLLAKAIAETLIKYL